MDKLLWKHGVGIYFGRVVEKPTALFLLLNTYSRPVTSWGQNVLLCCCKARPFFLIDGEHWLFDCDYISNLVEIFSIIRNVATDRILGLWMLSTVNVCLWQHNVFSHKVIIKFNSRTRELIKCNGFLLIFNIKTLFCNKIKRTFGLLSCYTS